MIAVDGAHQRIVAERTVDDRAVEHGHRDDNRRDATHQVGRGHLHLDKPSIGRSRRSGKRRCSAIVGQPRRQAAAAREADGKRDRIALVDIAEKTGGQRQGECLVNQGRLRCHRARHHRRVIGTVDCDVDDLGRAFRRCHRHEFMQHIAIGQRVDRRMAVVQRVAPAAGGIDRERAVGLGGTALDREARGIVGIADVEIASGGERRVLYDDTRRCPGNHSGIVCP